MRQKIHKTPVQCGSTITEYSLKQIYPDLNQEKFGVAK